MNRNFRCVVTIILTTGISGCSSTALLEQLDIAGDFFLVAKDLTVSTTTNTPVVASLELGDDVPDRLFAHVVTAPAHGSIEFDVTNGTYTYAPATDFTGQDLLYYRLSASAETLLSNTATITVSVTAAAGTDTTDAVSSPEPPSLPAGTLWARYINTATETVISWNFAKLDSGTTYDIYMGDNSNVTSNDTLVVSIAASSGTYTIPLSSRPASQQYYAIVARRNGQSATSPTTPTFGLHFFSRSITSGEATGFGGLYDVKWDGSGRILVPDYGTGRIFLFSANGVPLKKLTGLQVYQATRHSDGDYYFPNYNSSTIEVYDQDFQFLRTIPTCTTPGELVFAASSEAFLACYSSDELYRLSPPDYLASGSATYATGLTEIWSMDLSPDGRYLASARWSNTTVYLFDLVSGTTTWFDIPGAQIWDLSFSPDGYMYIQDNNIITAEILVYDTSFQLVDAFNVDLQGTNMSTLDLDDTGNLVVGTWMDPVLVYTP